MALPIPFISGAVVGAAVTYVVKDHAIMQWVSDTGDNIKDAASSLIGSLKKKPEAAAKKAKK